jgi:hypothetical protein
MKISSKNEFYSQWKYVELARYVTSLKRVIREKDKDGTMLYEYRRVNSYAQKYNNTGIYTSIWRFNSEDLTSAVRFGSLYFDIDNEDMQISYSEVKKLYSYLNQFIPEQSIIVYFTGKKGFHIECEVIALGINPGNNLPIIFRHIANDVKNKLDLSSLDFSVYDPRRMWRLEGSKHQDTGLYKNIISKEMLFSDIGKITSYCKDYHEPFVNDQEFSHSANEWYADYVRQVDSEKNKPKDVFSHFNQYGSSGNKTFSQSEKVFEKEKLLTQCSAIKKLEQQAKEKHYLEHEARLFLCSILTYSEEAVEYFHEILSNCEDYNISKSSAHINDWIKRRDMGIGGRPYTCERANSVGVGCGECSLEQKNKWVKVNGKFIETNEKSSPSPVRFAYSTKKEVNHE